jgi:hypothetical protein
MKKPSLFPILITSTLLLSACGGAQLGYAPERSVSESFAVAPVEQVFYEGEVAANQVFDASSEPISIERLVIRNANLTLVVVDPAQSTSDIASLAEGLGGFVVNSNVYQNTFAEGVFATQASITIRVPAERLNEALEQIKQDVVEVRSENISGQDVTQEYTDLESRLRNLESAEEELREIMGSLTKAEDVLNVYQSLRQVREEIEVIKGRMQYFEQSARLSAITIDLLPDVVSQPLQIGRWQPQGTAKAALEALISVLQFLANVAIWLLVFSPLIVPVVLIIRRWRKRRRARKVEMKQAEEE